MANFDKPLQQNKGFTLVELLVVIVIIGIIAAVAIPAFLNQRQRANDTAVQADVKNLSTSIESMLAGKPKGAITLSTDKKSLIADNQSERINTTDGINWNVYGSANGYCILGWHQNGKQYTNTTPLVYDSTKGGIQKDSNECEDIPASPNGSTFNPDGTVTEPATYNWQGVPHASTSTETSVSGKVRTNLAINSSAEAPTVGIWGHWAGMGSASATSGPVSDPTSISGTSVLRVRWNAASSTVNGGVLYGLKNTTAGEQYAMSMYVEPSKRQTLIICNEWYGPTVSGRISTNCGDTKTVEAGQWERMTIIDTASPLSDRATVRVYSVTGGSAWQANDYLDADALLVERSDVIGTYFDGSTPPKN